MCTNYMYVSPKCKEKLLRTLMVLYDFNWFVRSCNICIVSKNLTRFLKIDIGVCRMMPIASKASQNTPTNKLRYMSQRE